MHITRKNNTRNKRPPFHLPPLALANVFSTHIFVSPPFMCSPKRFISIQLIRILYPLLCRDIFRRHWRHIIRNLLGLYCRYDFLTMSLIWVLALVLLVYKQPFSNLACLEYHQQDQDKTKEILFSLPPTPFNCQTLSCPNKFPLSLPLLFV